MWLLSALQHCAALVCVTLNLTYHFSHLFFDSISKLALIKSDMKGLYEEISPEANSLSCIKRRGAFEQIGVPANCMVSIMLTVKNYRYDAPF